MKPGTATSPDLTVMATGSHSPGRSEACVMTVAQANPPPRGLTCCPVRASTKYGSTWQVLGNVSSIVAVPTLSTRPLNIATSGDGANVGFA
jgi:hypothetical protein